MIIKFKGKDSIKLLNEESFLTNYYELFFNGEAELIKSIEGMKAESHNFVIRRTPDTFNVNTLKRFTNNNFFIFVEGSNEIITTEVA